MKKILVGNKRKKRLYMDEPILPISSSFTKDLFKKPTLENTRRIAVLNKRFMVTLTDVMTTGDNATDLAGYGIEINRIKVTSDYKQLNVYWLAKNGINDDEIEKLLQSKSGTLRHELTQLHVIGVVPKIKFIKDKEYARIVEVETKLAYADFGEDYEISDAHIKYRSHLELTKSLDPQLKENILKLEENVNIEPILEDIPEMPQNVLGLNHAEIMNRVKISRRKSQASQQNQMSSSEASANVFNPDPIQFKSAKAQREAFRQFLAERQILLNKGRKSQKHYRPDWDYLEEESLILKQQQIDSFNLNDVDDRDYIDEDYELKYRDDEK
ncbi:Ribosome-binding factor A [Popillia japonica]|uniref:Ribosome-binding factor A n=1 Tax=Popillia japonica TaxID=7064 RepID=A0AAW1LFX1_POPJA